MAIFLYLCSKDTWWLLGRHSPPITKRESGGNPEQTRCCEFYSVATQVKQLRPLLHCATGRPCERWNKSENLPGDLNVEPILAFAVIELKHLDLFSLE